MTAVLHRGACQMSVIVGTKAATVSAHTRDGNGRREKDKIVVNVLYVEQTKTDGMF